MTPKPKIRKQTLRFLATFEDVVKTSTFVVNYQPEMFPVITAARQRHLPAEPPSSTLLGVQALARPEFLIEIEAMVVLS